jgi:hypothetical protein
VNLKTDFDTLKNNLQVYLIAPNPRDYFVTIRLLLHSINKITLQQNYEIFSFYSARIHARCLQFIYDV